MKTIQSNSAQKANMRSSRKSNKITTTPSSEKPKNEKEATSGKKLVQARLPFKILAGTPPSKPDGESVASSGISSKKRKLSYNEEPENQKKIGKSDSKENLTTLEKNDSDPSSEVIVLDDEESEEERPSNVSSPKTPAAAAVSSQSKKKKTTPRSSGTGGSTSMPKLRIRLPLIGKKKRKSKSISQSVSKTDASDSSDVELLSDEQHQNPQKKLKLGDLSKTKTFDAKEEEHTTLGDQVEDESQQIPSDPKSQNKLKTSPKSSSKLKVETSSKDNKKEEKQRSTPTEADPQTPKTSKLTRSSSNGINTGEDEPNKNSPKETRSSSKQSKELSQPNSPIKLNSSSKKNDDKEGGDSKISKEEEHRKEKLTPPEKKIVDAEISSKDTSVERQSSSPTKKDKSSRRSRRISGKTDDGAGDSSDPEIVSEKTNAADTSLNSNSELRTKLLTPKQRKLMEQRKKAREEKELKLQQLREERERKLQEQREERERKLQEEKVQKQKEREERELQRKKEREEKEDQKRREREEKEDQRRKEREDKERKRLAEIESKNEEKRKKDEAKEEERRKKDEERRRKELEKEEEENKKKKAAQAFTKFFVPKTAKPVTDEDPESREDAESVDSLAFRPFQVKGDMKLAPFVRREFIERAREKLDSFLKSTQTDVSTLYLGELKSGAHTPLKGLKTVLKNNDDEYDDVILISNELEDAAQAIDEPTNIPVQTYKAKYYFFRENQRPPFYGTWRKKSSVITPRRPFALDKQFFDYEVDSDDEWEEEEPGESLNGSEDEKDESEDEDYEVDNEWFVPHGHLSDEEMQNEDELGPDTSREAQKAKLKALQQEFAQEMKKKTEKIKPRLIGTIWEDENGNRPKLCPSIIWDSLCTRAMLFCEPPLVEEPEAPETEPSTPPPEKKPRIEINEELMKNLVRLVHGNRHSRVFLIKEFIEHVANTCEAVKNGECLAPTKTQIKEKIDEISEWSVVDTVNKKQKNKKKLCWVVAADVLDKYALGKLGMRNEWCYKLQPKFDMDKNDQNAAKETEEEATKKEISENPKTPNNDKKKPKPPGIAKFTKVLTKEEKQSQLAAPKCSASPKISKSSKETALASPKIEEIKKSNTLASKKSSPSTTVANKTPVVKKRVALLMSGPTGQEFSPQSKNALISQFLQKNKTTSASKVTAPTVSEKSSKLSVSSVTPMDVDEVILLD